MHRLITALGILWVLVGFVTVVIGAFVLVMSDFTGGVLIVSAGGIAITGGFALMGFAQIVEYFEAANRKQKHGNKQRRSS